MKDETRNGKGRIANKGELRCESDPVSHFFSVKQTTKITFFFEERKKKKKMVRHAMEFHEEMQLAFFGIALIVVAWFGSYLLAWRENVASEKLKVRGLTTFQ